MRHRRHAGQALVEFAFALPLFAMFMFTVIELSLVFITYYSETQMVSQTSRWLAINTNSNDLVVAQHVQNTLLPGLVGGTPTLVTAGTALVDTVYTVGRVTLQFTPCIPSAGLCTFTNRASGNTLHVQITYDAGNLLFLPTTFRLGSLVTTLPTSLPTYRLSLMVE